MTCGSTRGDPSTRAVPRCGGYRTVCSHGDTAYRGDRGKIVPSPVHHRILPPFGEPTDKCRVQLSFKKFLVVHHFAEKRKRSLDACNFVFPKGPSHPVDRFSPIAAVNSELRDHRIVIDR